MCVNLYTHVQECLGGLYRQEKVVKGYVYTVWRNESIFTMYVCEFTWKGRKGDEWVSECVCLCG